MYVCLAWSLQLVYRTGRRWIERVEGHGQTGGITTSAAIMWGGWGTADWGSLKQSLQSGQTILDLGWLMLTHKKAISVSDPLNRWKDNSPRADLMQCWGRLRTLTEGDQAERIWVGNFKTRSCFWVRERICITHSLFDGLSHVSLGSPFCGCVWIKYLLCLIFFFEKVKAMCDLVLQRCWPIWGQSVSCSRWEHMEYRWLLSYQGIRWVQWDLHYHEGLNQTG